ncbi:MAG TPA: carboxypeptidase-like regulatory domain-containing protein, partial [Vicinamibacterales bacterium]
MVRNRAVLVVASIVNVYFGAATVAAAQVRTTGQVAGTVRDASGGVVPNADLMLQDAGTGLVLNAKSDKEGGFTFPNLQPGKYVLTAVAQGFQSVTVDNVVVETSRATDVTVKFEVAGVQEKIQVEGRLPVIQTTSNTVSTTVNNAEIAKLPLSGRNILNFALLTPGAATSSDGRFSTFNGLPGGAINITLDGINNNSQRFKSGGTSFFTFAPERLGAIEEVTVQTAGLTADAGAEGAVQVQFVTKRGTNDVHWQVFDQFRNDALNSNTWFNAVRGLPKPKLHQNEWGANVGGPLKKGKLFYFANFEQIIAPSTSPQQRTVLTPEAQQGVFRYTATDGSIRTVNLLDIARANG